MVIRSWAKTRRRAAGRLRPGGKAPCRGRGLSGGLKHSIAPDQADESKVAVQPVPASALIVAKSQLLFAILMEALDTPAPIGQPQLGLQGATIHAPGEVPFGITGLTRQRPLRDQPTGRASDVAMSTMHAQ